MLMGYILEGKKDLSSKEETMEDQTREKSYEAQAEIYVDNKPGKKWVWKTKYKVEELVDKYKVRLIAKGCGQQKGENFEESFAPTTRLRATQLVLPISVVWT